MESWRRALACLPAENMSPSEQKQKEQYTAALEEAESVSNSKPRAVYFKAGEKDLPWDRAAAMKEDLQRRGENGDTSAFASSAWVILGAHAVCDAVVLHIYIDLTQFQRTSRRAWWPCEVSRRSPLQAHRVSPRWEVLR